MPQLEKPADYARSTDTPETLKKREGTLREIAGNLKEHRQARRVDRPKGGVLSGIVQSLQARLADASVVNGKSARVTVRRGDSKETLAAQGVEEDVLSKMKN